MTSGWALDQLAGALPAVDTLRDRRISTTLDVVSEAFSIERRALTAASIRLKDKTVLVARQLAAYLLREDCGLSFKEVATQMGWRNHTSAHDAFKHIEELQERDDTKKLANVIQTIREMVATDMNKLTIDKPTRPGLRM